MRTCSVEGCGRRAGFGDLCAHHKYRKDHGLPMTGEIVHVRAECSVDGCHGLARCRGLCPRHYQRLRRFGDVNGAVVQRINAAGTTCRECGSDRVVARGLCDTCYHRLRRRGDIVPGGGRC